MGNHGGGVFSRRDPYRADQPPASWSARGQDYADAGEEYYDQRDREHLIRRHQHALARLGCQVTLIPPGDSSPPPGQAA